MGCNGHIVELAMAYNHLKACFTVNLGMVFSVVPNVALITANNFKENSMADLQEHKNIATKYAGTVHQGALDGMAKTYALVLTNKDSQFVSCGDTSERDTVRKNFLQKKLGLADGDDKLNAAIESVCVTMKEDRFKSRLAFYYLLAAYFGKLESFVK